MNKSAPASFLINSQLAGQPFFLQGSRQVAVLLYHGLTATCAEVYRLGQSLHQAGCTVRGPLLPGHGTRPHDLDKIRWQDWTAAAEGEYQALKRQYARVIVGGESTGGLIALYLASQHPEIAALLAYAPALRLDMSPIQRLIMPLLARTGYHLPKGGLSGNTTWQGYRVNPLRALWQLMRLQQQVEPRLDQIRQPTLIVQGRNDHTIDPHSSEIVRDKICSTVKELHWMEHSGHCVLIDDEAGAVAAMTVAFLARNVGGV